MVPGVIGRRRRREKESGGAEPEAPKPGQFHRQDDSRKYVSPVSLALACLVWGVGVVGVAVAAAGNREGLIGAFAVGGVLVGFYLLFSLKVANQWERAVVLRFGKFQGLKGPGLFSLVPIVDQVSHLVDQRVRVTDVSAESALTRDTVPVNVDAIVFWTVWDAQKAVLEVADYLDAIALSPRRLSARRSAGTSSPR